MFIKNGSYKKHTHIISYVPPTIITQPVGGVKNVGTYFKFSVFARGSRPLTYQWYKNYDPILNETSNELILPSLQISDDGSYFCEIKNNGYTVESDIVDLTVVDNLIFSKQPESVSANTNSNVLFDVIVDSDTSVYYKWYKNYVSYPGISNKLYINHVTKNDEGTYFCVAYNLLTSITSNNVTLKINDPIIIKTQPNYTSSSIGDDLVLSLSCVGTFPISAQWRKDNTNYGSLSVTNNGDVKLEINNIQTSDEGNYDCVLSNVVGSITSNKALFYINKPPEFTLNPVSGIGFIGGSFTFTSNATGTNPISYQWIKENYGNITDATLKDLTLNNLTYSNSGKYACVASNLYGTITSNMVMLSTKDIILTNRNWYDVAMSSDGTIQTAVVRDGQIYVSTDSGNTWTAKETDRKWYSVAMSSDGTKQTAVVYGGQIYISTDSGNTWTPKESNRSWRSVAMSSDGTKQTAVVDDGRIYISTDSGNTWTPKESNRSWRSVAMSSDGTKQTAYERTFYPDIGFGGSSKGYIYVSSNSGNTWKEIINAGERSWSGIAISSDGTKQTAVDYSGFGSGGQIYISTDSGNTWTSKGSNRNWTSVAMSSDGTKQTAMEYRKNIYISTDSGNTWTPKESNRKWYSVAMSSDGTKQTAIVYEGQIYVSTDYGDTWTAKF